MNLRHLITSGELEVHEPNSSSPLVITSSRRNGTLFHRSSVEHSISLWGFFRHLFGIATLRHCTMHLQS